MPDNRARRALLYFGLCLTFWLLAWLSPLRWASAFMKADYHHIYNHAYYLFLFLSGMLLKVDVTASYKAVLWKSVVAGLIAGCLAYMAVVLSRSDGIELLTHMDTSVMEPMLISGLLLGTPLWAAMIGGLDLYLRRKRPVFTGK